MNKKILAVDYGTKRIGLAITDDSGEFAFSYKIIVVSSFEDAIKKLLEIIEKEEPSTTLFGLPQDKDGNDTPFSKKIKSFIERLQEEVPTMKIETWNEILTSKLAENNAKKVKYKKKMIDSEAARIILQEYLNYKEEIK